MPYIPKGAVPVQTKETYIPKGAQPVNTTPQPSYTPVQNTANSVADAAPIVGGIAGGLGGAVAGLGIGSIPAGALGAAGGTGAGLAVKNVIKDFAGTQDQTIDQQAVESVKEPVVAGVADLAASGVINAATPVFKGIGSLVKPSKTAVDLFESIFTLPRTVAEKIGIRKVAPQLLEDGMGGKSLEEMVQVADQVAGKNGIVNAAAREASNAHGASIGIDNAMTAAENIAEQNRAFLGGGAATKKAQDAIVQNVQGNIRRTILGRSPTGIGKISAIDAYDAAKQLESIAYSFEGSAAKSTVQDAHTLQMKALAKIYKSAADELITSVDQLPASKEVVQTLKTPETIAALEEISQNLAKKFKSATSFKELRAIMSPYVKVSQAAQQTMAQANTPITKLLGGELGFNNLFGLTKIPGEILQTPEATGSIAGGLYNAGKVGAGVKPLFDFLGKAAPLGVRSGAQAGVQMLP